MHDDENLRFYAKNKIIELTKIENIILKELIKNKGKVVTLEDLCKIVYLDKLDICYEANLRTHIYRLRNKLENEVIIKNDRKQYYTIR